MSTQSSRPWYVPDRKCDRYRRMAENGGDIEVLQKIKAVRMLSVNFIIGTLAAYMVMQGGDPTVIGSTSILVLGALNGVEFSDWAAAKQALHESKSQ